MTTNIAELKKLRNEIGCIPVMADEDETFGYETYDNVANALASYFESRPECPDDDVNRETGWSQWAMNRTNNVLDRIAGIFIKKHSALLGEYAQPVTIEEAIIRNGNGYIELGHPMFKAFLTSIAEVFDRTQEAENYMEFGVHGDRGDFYITIQKAEGKSPGQVNSELKAENAKLKMQCEQKDAYIEMQQADIAELSNEVQRLREMIMDLERDNAELKACKTQRNVFG